MDPVAVRLTDQASKRLDARCAALGISKSEWVRRAVDAQLDAEETAAILAEQAMELAGLRERVGRLERAASGR